MSSTGIDNVITLIGSDHIIAAPSINDVIIGAARYKVSSIIVDDFLPQNVLPGRPLHIVHRLSEYAFRPEITISQKVTNISAHRLPYPEATALRQRAFWKSVYPRFPRQSNRLCGFPRKCGRK
jgi:hypothetical protein